MSLFKPSTETAKDPHLKVLLWGPPGAGKTHFMMGAPGLALLDVETRATNFAMRQTEFNFLHAKLPTLDDFAEALKEIRLGRIACESIGMDSGSAFYLKLVVEHTKRSEQGNYVTDWVTVNRRFLAALTFVFSVDKNVVVSMHAGEKLVRDGRDNFRREGQQFIGDSRFRFGFDYILRIEPKGDPTKSPALFHVEKTSSPALHVGEAISGLTWGKLREITGPAKRQTPSSASPAPVDEPPVTDGFLTLDQRDRIEVLMHQVGIAQSEFVTLTKNITARRTPLYQELTAREAATMIANLEKRLNERNAA